MWNQCLPAVVRPLPGAGTPVGADRRSELQGCRPMREVGSGQDAQNPGRHRVSARTSHGPSHHTPLDRHDLRTIVDNGGFRVPGFADSQVGKSVGTRLSGIVDSRIPDSRICGFMGSRVSGFVDSRVRGFPDPWVCGLWIRGFADSGVCGFTSLRVRGFTGSRLSPLCCGTLSRQLSFFRTLC